MNSWVLALSVTSLLLSGCKERPKIIHPSDLPELREPADFVPKPQAHVTGGKPSVPKLTRETIQEHLPPPPPVVKEPAAIPVETTQETPPPQKPTEAEEPEIDPTIEEQARWLAEVNVTEGGCLRDGTQPAVNLPSAKTIARILKEQPANFRGIAREALVCLLELPKATGAEVYGKSAFRSEALAAEFKMVGGNRPQEILVAIITTDEPRGEGTLIAVLDARDDGRHLRHALYLPWQYSDRGRRIITVTSSRVLRRKRREILIRQIDAKRTVEQYVALTTTESLIPLAEIVTKERLPDNVLTSGTVKTTGSWPKTLLLRSVISSDGGKRWQLQDWIPDRENTMIPQEAIKGEFTLEDVRRLTYEQRPYDANWVFRQLPKKKRSSFGGRWATALISSKKRHHKAAKKQWKRVLSSKVLEPTAQRDFGLYQWSRKEFAAGRKAIEAYLAAVPNATDRGELEAILAGAGDTP